MHEQVELTGWAQIADYLKVGVRTAQVYHRRINWVCIVRRPRLLPVFFPELAKHKLPANVIVLALPRGGVPVGREVAKALQSQKRVHIKNIFAKLGVNDRTRAATVAARRGIIDVHHD